MELEHNQKFWLTWNRTTSMWAFLKVNDHVVVEDYSKSQWMQCVVCHSIQQEVIRESSTQNWKKLIMYNKNHGITAMSQHVVSKHSAMLKQYNTWWTTTTIIIVIHQISKKWKNPSIASIANFFNSGVPCKNSNHV